MFIEPRTSAKKCFTVERNVDQYELLRHVTKYATLYDGTTSLRRFLHPSKIESAYFSAAIRAHKVTISPFTDASYQYFPQHSRPSTPMPIFSNATSCLVMR